MESEREPKTLLRRSVELSVDALGMGVEAVGRGTEATGNLVQWTGQKVRSCVDAPKHQ